MFEGNNVNPTSFEGGKDGLCAVVKGAVGG
jgi:hypothetical protein